MLCVAVNINIENITHITGKENWLCDALSRRGSNHPVSIQSHATELGLADVMVIDVAIDDDVMALLELCRPCLGATSEQKFVSFWEEARSAVESFVARFPYLFIPRQSKKRRSSPDTYCV